MDDHAERDPQDPVTFQRVLAAHPGERRRLQELAHQIPQTDGIGHTLHLAKERCARLRAELSVAQQEAEGYGKTLATRYALMTEERRILESLGLTQNLYLTPKPYDPEED